VIRKIVVETQAVTALVGAGRNADGKWHYSDGVGTSAEVVPYGLALTNDNEVLYMTECGSNRVRKVIVESRTVSTFAGSASGSFGYADGIGTAALLGTDPNACFGDPAISNDGAVLYVSDRPNRRIRKIIVATQQVTTFAGSGTAGTVDGIGTSASLSYVIGMAVSSNDAILYFTDIPSPTLGETYGLIRKIDIATKTVSTFLGPGTASASYVDGIGTAVGLGHWYGAFQLSPSRDGEMLYAANRRQARQVNLLTNQVTTLAGAPGPASAEGYADGVGTSALFKGMFGAAVTRDGTVLYIGDNNNHRVRAIGTGRIITSAPTPHPLPAPTPMPNVADTGTCYASTSTVTVLSRNDHARRLNVPIAEVQVGDHVLAVDDKHRGKFAKVLSVPCSKSLEDFVEVTIVSASTTGTKDIKQLKVTLHHTFPTCTAPSDGIQALNLKEGKCLHTSSGPGAIKSVKVVPATENDKTCSIILEGARVLAVGGIFTDSKAAGANSRKNHVKMAHKSLRGD